MDDFSLEAVSSLLINSRHPGNLLGASMFIILAAWAHLNQPSGLSLIAAGSGWVSFTRFPAQMQSQAHGTCF